MSTTVRQLSQSHDISAKVAQVLQTRTKFAVERFGERVHQAYQGQLAGQTANPIPPQEIWASGAHYAVDCAQRSVLLWDTMRRRGNDFIGHERQGLPPVLHFDYELLERVLADKRVQRVQPPRQNRRRCSIASAACSAGLGSSRCALAPRRRIGRQTRKDES